MQRETLPQVISWAIDKTHTNLASLRLNGKGIDFLEILFLHKGNPYCQHTLGARPYAVAPRTWCNSHGSWLESRNQMVLAITNQVYYTTHGFKRLTQ
jgi:hypothetical protein